MHLRVFRAFVVSHWAVPVSSVSARGIAKSYPVGATTLQILRDLDLDVASGEMVAIVGASGVGKSTLLHVLGGLDHADTGSVTIGDANVTSMADADRVAFRNRRVGFVFQFHHLLPEFSAIENAEMPMRIARMPLSDARPRAEELLRRVGLGERLTHRPGMLSGGSSPTPTRWPNNFVRVCRSASGNGGAKIEATFIRR